METERQPQENSRKVYELAFLIAPTITEENLPAVFENLKGTLSKAGAVFISEDFPKLSPLAYSMDKTIEHKRRIFNTGYFGWIKFEFEPEHMLNLKEELKHFIDLIRFMIINTARESTLAPRRSHVVRRRPASIIGRVKSVEPAKPIDEEAVDKKIEELITA